MEHAPLKKHVQ